MLATGRRTTREQALIVGDNPVWGDLAFETAATRATVARRVLHRLGSAPSPVLSGLLLLALVLVGHAAFLGVLVSMPGAGAGVDFPAGNRE